MITEAPQSGLKITETSGERMQTRSAGPGGGLSQTGKPSPRIAFCITCKGRAQHLKVTLPRNLADNLNYANCVFVVLDYSSQDDLATYMQSLPEGYYRSRRLAYYRYPDATSFKIGHAKNMAHRCGLLEGADILVNLDADNFTGYGFAEYIANKFEPQMFLFTEMIKGVLTRGVNGRICVSANQFLKAGGYDEKFEVWANDDKDFHVRLMRLDYRPQAIDQVYLMAISHTDKMRFREYPHAAKINFYDHKVAIDASDVTVANFGWIGCGTVFRNFDAAPVVLARLPTRIFGIGMHKTATTSLHRAMNRLGFDSAHWITAHWAKAIWTEMKLWEKSLTLEKHYHLCDLPIPILFRELDRAYPGSKFILTMLDDETWVQAAEVHWSRRNKFRGQWDHDPFSNQIHRVIYGQKNFDREVFVARYRRHNAEVLEHFKDRPGDLLVMNMSAGAGWKELCGFVGRPEPEVAYPHANPNYDMWMGG